MTKITKTAGKFVKPTDDNTREFNWHLVLTIISLIVTVAGTYFGPQLVHIVSAVPMVPSLVQVYIDYRKHF